MSSKDDKENDISNNKRRKSSTTKKKNHSILNNENASSNRKFGQATRTTRACDLCRKQKTRCFRSPDKDSCLRCSFLGKKCSFEENLNRFAGKTDVSRNEEDTRKLDLIHSGVQELLFILKDLTSTHFSTQATFPASAFDVTAEPTSLLGQGTQSGFTNDMPMDTIHTATPQSEQYFQLDKSLYATPSQSFVLSPFSMIKNIADTAKVPRPITQLGEKHQESPFARKKDIISLEIIPEAEVIDLIQNLRTNYEDWLLFPLNKTTSELVEGIRQKLPLLLSTCCLISMRTFFRELFFADSSAYYHKKNTYVVLFNHLRAELTESMQMYVTSSDFDDEVIEFVQAMVLLSTYSYSLTTIKENIEVKNPLLTHLEDKTYLDPWTVSSIGLTTLIKNIDFGTVMDNMKSKSSLKLVSETEDIRDAEYEHLTIIRLFNHLTLAHLVNCLFSGRMCIIDEIRLNYCPATLSLASATNFDGRMIAEIGVLLITYNFVQVSLNSGTLTNENECEMNYYSVREELAMWYDNWCYIFYQPEVQFVEITYFFCYLLVDYIYCFKKASYCKEIPSLVPGSVLEEASFTYILENAEETLWKNMIGHAYQLIFAIIDIGDPTILANVSDEIHFCAFYSAAILLKLLSLFRFEKTSIPLTTGFADIHINLILQKIQLLIHKFDEIGFPQFTTSKYAEALRSSMQGHFPYYDSN